MKNLRAVLVIPLLMFVNILIAQTETKEEKLNDPLDFSEQKEQIEQYGVPTIITIAEMKIKSDALFEAKSWKEAAISYEIYAKNANWLANLLSQCIEPYYSASYDKKRNFWDFSSITPYEEQANKIKEDRNTAYVKIGLCYKNLGDIKNAVVYLYKALDVISIEDKINWAIARNALSEILQYRPEE